MAPLTSPVAVPCGNLYRAGLMGHPHPRSPFDLRHSRRCRHRNQVVGHGGYGSALHLFADSSLGDYEEEAAALLLRRTLVFLEWLS